MRGLGVGHPNDPIGGLNGGPLGAFHLSELPLGESPSCPPFDGWWAKPLGTWVGKLVLTYIVVGINVITCS
jgi:hypothetical protein